MGHFHEFSLDAKFLFFRVAIIIFVAVVTRVALLFIVIAIVTSTGYSNFGSSIRIVALFWLRQQQGLRQVVGRTMGFHLVSLY